MLLVVGNKTYSSWSLRPWVLMKHFGIAFEEKLIKLDMPDTHQQIQQYSRAGKVPVLIDGDVVIWDSLAIMEYLNEKFPEKNMWPKDMRIRAKARAITCEMHSGFQTMRNVMSHHLKKTFSNFNWSEAESDVNRVKEIWRSCLREHRGKYLFGEFSIADAMFAPVVNRFITYGIPIEADLKSYVDAIRTLPAHHAWINDAIQEDFNAPKHEIAASA